MSEQYRGKRIVLSGGFDPVHVGHVRMFKAAKELVGEKGEVIVVLNCDNWLIRKKGKRFMDQKERAELIESIEAVDTVYIHESDELHVSEALRTLKPDIFGNGGDRRNEGDIPETDVCKELGIKMVFNIGEGGKIQSSSWLLRDYHART